MTPYVAQHTAQWRKGIWWLGKDEADVDVEAVGLREIIKSKAVRKISDEGFWPIQAKGCSRESYRHVARQSSQVSSFLV